MRSLVCCTVVFALLCCGPNTTTDAGAGGGGEAGGGTQTGGGGGSGGGTGGGDTGGGSGGGSATDGGVDPDAGADDAGTDAGSMDAGLTDAGATDAGPTDAGSDAGIVVVVCQTLAPLPSSLCRVDAGDDGRVIIGDVLTPTKVFRGGQVVIDAQGEIVGVGCQLDCDNNPNCAGVALTATTVTCPQGVISPGLINAHDHLTYDQNSPWVNVSGERWEHRHDWRSGRGGHTSITAAGGATADQMSWAELRALFGGTTSIVGSGGAAGLVRNLDNAAFSGLASAPPLVNVFPLNDATPPSGYPSAVACGAFPNVIAETNSALLAANAYVPHVGEGLNAYANNEFVCLSDQNSGHDVILLKTAIVGGVGFTAPQLATMSARGASLVWSPRSDVSLYGNTAPVTLASRLGVSIALGTDWIVSGSMNPLRELRCADLLNRDAFARFFSDRDLWLMVTANAARAVGAEGRLGTLAPGKLGDLAIFDGRVHPLFRAVIDAEPQDVALVLRQGKPLYGDQALITQVPNVAGCDLVDVCGAPRSVCLSTEIGKTYPALEAAIGAHYGAFFCGGPPMNETSCVPSRPSSVNGSTIYTGARTASDSDGDGIDDSADDCPNVFNPIRPMDLGQQADFDLDGIGDACDVCPLDANTTACTAVDPNDVDADGVPNALDNCPRDANGNQLDADSDGKGDVCDLCPMASNPGSMACPSTIYAIKGGTVVPGSTVSLRRQLVTAANAQGFFIQVKNGDPDWNGSADHSGLFVLAPGNTLNAGDRVTISNAVVQNYFNQLQLTQPVTTVDSSGEAPPVPLDVLPAEVATGGMRADALEGVLVRVQNVMVTNLMPPLGSGDSAPNNEFAIDGSLRVNDFLYLVTPFPSQGQSFGSLTGILEWRNSDSKLEPRSAADVVGGAPSLAAFGPASSFLDVGQMMSSTVPTALTLTLASAPVANTFVPIISSSPSSLTVVGGGVTVPAGSISAPVLLNGLQQANDVTLSATLGSTTLVAHVRVLGASEQPVITSLTPASASLGPGGTITLTATLDFPARAAGSVVSLSLTPANAGLIPATITVPAGQLSGTFTYTDGSTASSATVTGTLGASSATSVLTLTSTSCTTNHLVISEVRSRGAAGAADEFIELYNPTTSAVVLDNTWRIEARSNAASAYSSRWVGTGKTIPAHGHFLIAGTGYVVAPAADEAMSTGITDAMSLRLSQSGTVVDSVCYAFDAASAMPFSSDATYTCEGAPATNPHNNAAATNTATSIERKPGSPNGNCTDTQSSVSDFQSVSSNPESSTSPTVP